ncbi:hypothetical protein [Vibrio splendidus]
MKRLLYPIALLFSSVSLANESFEVVLVSDGFTMNKEPAISVI